MKRLLEIALAPMFLILCASSATGFQLPPPAPGPGTQLFQTVFQTDFATAGVGGMRGLGFGDITLSGVDGPVTQAYLYWHGPERVNMDAPGNENIFVNGMPVTGTSIGVSDDNCWNGIRFRVSHSYRADVTSQVQASGTGTYALTGLGPSAGDGMVPRVGTNGASLVVFFDDGDPSNDRDVVIFDGNDSNLANPHDTVGWQVALRNIDCTSGPARLQLHVADGQVFPESPLFLNGANVLQPAGPTFQGDSVPSDNDGPTGDGSLWDIKTFDVTSFLSAQSNSNDLSLRMGGISGDSEVGGGPRDCISLVVAIFDLPAGTAPSDPVPGNTAPRCGGDLGLLEPGFEGCADLIINAGEDFSVDLVGVDDDAGDVLTLSVSGLPTMATLTPTAGASGPSPLEAVLLWNPDDSDAPGPHSIAVTYTDLAGESSTCHFDLTVNRVPDCVLPYPTEGIIVECTSPDGALVALDGSGSSDADGDTLLFNWAVSDIAVMLSSTDESTTTGVFPIGITMVTLTVADGRGGVASCDVLVSVLDTVPPEVMCTTDTAMLWPPNHKMVDVTLMVLATDDCSAPDYVFPVIVTVRSDEPDDEDGDGSSVGDVNGADGFTSPVVVDAVPTENAGEFLATIPLRAERAGGGDGRKYTIDVTAIDSAGNETTTSACVVVPHDKKGK